MTYLFIYLFITVNGGYNHCNLISEKKNMMDMEMTGSSVPVCRQGLFIHTGNSLMRDHHLSCERLLHVGQLNLAHSDIRYHCFIGWCTLLLWSVSLLELFPSSIHGCYIWKSIFDFYFVWKAFGCWFSCTARLEVRTAGSCMCVQTAVQGSARRSCCLHSHSPLLCGHSSSMLRSQWGFC